MNQSRPDEMVIYVRSSLDREIMDFRIGKAGLKFGTLRAVSRQYGIKHEILDRCIKFTAPKGRLQIFIEKLHFSLTPYSETIF